MRHRSISFFLFLFSGFMCLASIPRISIITSLYKGEAFIEGFLKDITRQTVFNECELIIINANSPEHEDPIIKRYQQTFSNIFYIRLPHDPGLYAVWNLGIMSARGEFITNANVDDRLSPYCYQTHMQALDNEPEAALVYSNIFVTNTPHETFEQHTRTSCIDYGPFNRKVMASCPPSCNPMWRKSMHDRYGLFDANYKHAGDWEMWCRAFDGGAKFIRVDGFYGLYYNNPVGLSTNKTKMKEIETERQVIIKKYRHIWK